MQLTFSPLLPMVWILILGLPVIALCLYKKLWLRSLLFIALLIIFLQPVRQEIEEQGGDSQVVLITDQSRSTSPFKDDIRLVEQGLLQKIAAIPYVQVQPFNTKDSAALGSTPLQDTLNDVIRLGQDVAGVILVTDGQISLSDDAYPVPLHIFKMPTPPHDRWVEITSSPSFALVNKLQPFKFIVHDTSAPEVAVILQLPEQAAQTLTVPTNQEVVHHFTLSHTGPAAVSVSTPVTPKEVVTANNQAAALVNGVRETFSVLLITGSPHNGTRSLRQVLKGDAGVNLVHFSILRTVYSRDGAPRSEMSLIPFPTDKLFGEQLKDFDLVVFDNFISENLGLYEYYDHILDYVDQGGSVFVLGNDTMADYTSIMQTPLARLMPFEAVNHVKHNRFTPVLTSAGKRHPVTSALLDQEKSWSALGQQVAVSDPQGHVLMTGDNAEPLLILHAFNRGRVAALLTSQLWLWDREVPGGPQTELLKRITHWLMRAPSLEANQLQLSANQNALTLTYQNVDPLSLLQVTLLKPDGSQEAVTLSEENRFSAQFDANLQGLYTAQAGDLRAYAVIGSAQDREWQRLPDQDRQLAEYAAQSGGRVFEVSPDHLPDIREVKRGGRTSGRGWLGLPPGVKTTEIRGETALLAPWMQLSLLLGLLVATWAQEGRFTWRKRD